MLNAVRAIVLWLLTAVCAPACAHAAVNDRVPQYGPPPARSGRLVSGGPPAAQTVYFSPHDAVIAAARDLASINIDRRKYIRYLTNYNIESTWRIPYIQTTNFLVNSISRARVIKPPYVVPGTDNTLLRIDITDYQFYDETNDKYVGWDPKVWDAVGERDVYFTGRVVKVDREVTVERVKKVRQVPTGRKEYARDQYGRYYLRDGYRTEEYYEDVRKEGDATQKVVRSIADWVDATSMKYLQDGTESAYPILRGDFFVAHASLPPFYHDFLAFGKKVDDFLAAVVVSKADIKKAQLELKGIVVKSGVGFSGKVIPVSAKNRFLSRAQGPYGYIWRTRDVEKLLDVTDYLRTLDDGQFDASEWIVTGRTGLQWYFLSDKNDLRQDEAPIAIVRDNTNVDRRVRNGRSCITCHPRGINEFKALPQELVRHHIDVISPDLRKIKKLRETFTNNLDEFVDGDNRVYARAVQLATTVVVGGKQYWLDTERNASQFSRVYDGFFEEYVDINRASFECGVPVKDLMVIFAEAKNDPYLLGLSRNKPLFSVPREQWERSFQQAMLLVLKARRGYR